MIRNKDPFEYEITPEILDRGEQWVTLRLKNTGMDMLQKLDVKLHSLDSFHLSVDTPSAYIPALAPNEERFLNFQVNATSRSHLYITVKGNKEGRAPPFIWDSPWVQEEVTGEPAKLESIFVSNPYGAVGKELEVEATVQGVTSNSGALDLRFWADTPSGKYEELATIKTKKLSPGEEVSYTAHITPKEEGFYNVYATLYDSSNRRIDRDSDIIWVEAS
ncbi:MAG: hypothetical protein ABI361_06840 [Nitrososphaera sp.]|jgi:hypothetical protein